MPGPCRAGEVHQYTLRLTPRGSYGYVVVAEVDELARELDWSAMEK